ncbi:MAG: NBR1-Ig-like domain-containing protein [Anaerolineae bacterium]
MASQPISPSPDTSEQEASRRTLWLVAATVTAVLACLISTAVLVGIIAPAREATPTPLSNPPNEPDTPDSATDLTGCVPDAEFVADVTVPDGTVIEPGATFLKAWRVRNSGTCRWVEGYVLRFVDGAEMAGPATVSVAAAPGELAEVAVSLTAPETPGTYRGNWQLCASETRSFGPMLFVDIVVADQAAAHTLTATAGAVAVASSTLEPTADLTPSASDTPEEPTPTYPPDPGASAWLAHNGQLIGVREVTWDTELGPQNPRNNEVYLSLYVVAVATGDSRKTINPLDLHVIDGKGEVHDRAILVIKDPEFALCMVGHDERCEGWWTTVIPDNSASRRDLTLRWQPGLFAPELETAIRVGGP